MGLNRRRRSPKQRRVPPTRPSPRQDAIDYVARARIREAWLAKLHAEMAPYRPAPDLRTLEERREGTRLKLAKARAAHEARRQADR